MASAVLETKMRSVHAATAAGATGSATIRPPFHARPQAARWRWSPALAQSGQWDMMGQSTAMS